MLLTVRDIFLFFNMSYVDYNMKTNVILKTEKITIVLSIFE